MKFCGGVFFFYYINYSTHWSGHTFLNIGRVCSIEPDACFHQNVHVHPYASVSEGPEQFALHRVCRQEIAHDETVSDRLWFDTVDHFIHSDLSKQSTQQLFTLADFHQPPILDFSQVEWVVYRKLTESLLAWIEIKIISKVRVLCCNKWSKNVKDRVFLRKRKWWTKANEKKYMSILE